MNKLGLILIVCLLALSGCGGREEGFVIKGRIPGMPDSLSVALLTGETLPAKTIAEAVVKDGYFELRGKVEAPTLCTLITNNLGILSEEDMAAGRGIRWTYTPVFVDNVAMEVRTSHYDSIPNVGAAPGFRIAGGEVQEDFTAYVLSLAGGAETSRKRWDFILSHPCSVVSLYLGDKLMEDGYNLSREEVDRLDAAITDVPADTARLAAFRRNCAYARLTAVGSPVVDLEMCGMEGDTCHLAERIPVGRYVLVDFWATWCGPCMAAIPVIKELASRYREDFVVVGVSCDKDVDAWKAAIRRENTPWPHYRLTAKGIDDFHEKYQTGGVPYFLLLDREGNVLERPRTAEAVVRAVDGFCGGERPCSFSFPGRWGTRQERGGSRVGSGR